MASTNGNTNESETSYHSKLDLILTNQEDLKDLLAEVIEKLNNFAIEQEAYGLNYLVGREDN